MIIVKNVTKTFKRKKAVDNFSLEMGNCVYSLLGANGSGKTTLVRMITHVLREYEGEIFRRGEEAQEDASSDFSVGYLPQKFGVFKELTLMEQMLYFANLKQIPYKSQREAIKEVLEIVNLSDKVNDRCSTLSGGMVRRVGIAQAILGDPDIILFDEPTAGLDPEERLRFKRIIYRIKEKCPILLSTHIVEDVEAVSDRIIIMKDGQKIIEDKIENIIAMVNDRVYETDIEEIEDIKEPHIVSKYTDTKDEKRKARIIYTGNDIGAVKGIPLVPTVEDGYIYVLNCVGDNALLRKA